MVEIFDQYLNPIQNAMLSLRTDTKCLQWRETKNMAEHGDPGHYHIAFYTEKCYKYIFKSFVNGNCGIEYDEPFELPVYILTPLPGELAVEYCFEDRQQLKGTVGVEGVIMVHKRDRFNNKINADVFNRTEDDRVFSIRCESEVCDGGQGRVSKGTVLFFKRICVDVRSGGQFRLSEQSAESYVDDRFCL